MIGGYAQQSYGFNYYGTVGSNRDEFVIRPALMALDVTLEIPRSRFQDPVDMDFRAGGFVPVEFLQPKMGLVAEHRFFLDRQR